MLLLGVVLTGCSSKYDALVRDVQALKTELGRMRTNNMVLQDRVDAIEERGPGSEMASSTDTATKPGDRPVLEVVTLTPQDEPSEAAPPATQVEQVPDGKPRPTIVGDSDGVEQLAEGEKNKVDKKAKPAGHGHRSPRGAR